MLPTTHTPSSDVISLPILYLVQDTSSIPPTTPPRSLQVYTRHSRTNTEPLTDSSPMAISMVQEFGMTRSTSDHSVFFYHTSFGLCIYLIVYVDDIVIIGIDQDAIRKLKQHFFNHFQKKDLGKLKYFMGIEIAKSKSGVVMSWIY